MTGEFALINRYFTGWDVYQAGVVLGVGDDCALLDPGNNRTLAISVDTMVVGVHFLADTPPAIIGYRSLAVSVSDLAAMGVEPLAFTLALTLPDATEQWLAEFSRGLRLASAQFGISLIGGDTTRGPLIVSIQVIGTCPKGEGLRRQGTAVGDLVCVSGFVGDAGAGLHQLQSKIDVRSLSLDSLLAEPSSVCARFLCPAPRLILGQLLRGYASACIDVSDGLIADLGHIVRASGCGAIIDSRLLLLSQGLRCSAHPDVLMSALTAGDDYELCFTISVDRWQVLKNDAEFARVTAQLPVTVIGEITHGTDVVVLGSQGEALEIKHSGYHHF